MNLNCDEGFAQRKSFDGLVSEYLGSVQIHHVRGRTE